MLVRYITRSGATKDEALDFVRVHGMMHRMRCWKAWENVQHSNVRLESCSSLKRTSVPIFGTIREQILDAYFSVQPPVHTFRGART
jgi:hypothetical protein